MASGSKDTPAPDAPTTGPPVLVLNQRRDSLDALAAALRAAGHEVVEGRSLAESRELLTTVDPLVVVLNPLVLNSGGVEFELLEALRGGEQIVPVILLVPSSADLGEAQRLALPFLDFLVEPYTVEECVARVALALENRRQLLELKARARELEGQVSVDFKTELLSERYFKQLLQIEFKRAQRHRTPLSLLLVDVDDFKDVNDSTEYAFGDEVLRHVAQHLKRTIRETDFAARFGGDEFVLLLPQTTPAEAVQTAIRIRKKISKTTVEAKQYACQVTVSIGIDTYDGITESSPDELRTRANKALQEAKQRGKDQVWLYTPAGSGRPVEK